MKEQAEREAKEKDELMKAALNDPSFRQQMEALQEQKMQTKF